MNKVSKSTIPFINHKCFKFRGYLTGTRFCRKTKISVAVSFVGKKNSYTDVLRCFFTAKTIKTFSEHMAFMIIQGLLNEKKNLSVS